MKLHDGLVVKATTIVLTATALLQADGFAPHNPTGRTSTGRPTTRRPFTSSSSIIAATPTVTAAEATTTTTTTTTCQVLVFGSGPAGRSIASLLAKQGVDVVLADRNADRAFPPNYGVWEDEWQTICHVYEQMGVTMTGGRANGGQGNAIDWKWEMTDCFFGGSFDIPTSERLRLDRPYLRVDRTALKQSLSEQACGYRVIRANHLATTSNVPNIDPSGTIRHDAMGSTVQLDNGDIVRATLIVDGTGHETKLTVRDAREITDGPGFQIAYGCLVDVAMTKNVGDGDAMIGPYDKQSMTLFDYRTDHYDDADEMTQQKVAKAPTFMYTMPLGGNQVFFEETSLVARPALSFQECKDRCLKRLEYHGITITKLHEEEFCYIPMGGALPAKDQRIIAIGGAAAMVHPATGYHLCRCLMGASDVANVIVQELLADDNQTNAAVVPDLDRIAGLAYHALWSPANQRQRNFSIFGGEYLMKQNVAGLRGFFGGFFKLPLPLWAGFLAGWPGLPNNERHATWVARLWFGVNFLIRLHPSVALDMVANIVYYIAFENLALAQSVTPFLGEPQSYACRPNRDRVGDVAAKMEARQMILAGSVPMDVPVDFEGEQRLKVTAAAATGDQVAAPSPPSQVETVSTFE
jgi:lycopene beta-cyclase